MGAESEARRLTGDVQRALADELGEAVVASATFLGAGTDHRAFLVDERLVVRTGSSADAVAREATLLAVLAARGLPVPTVELALPQVGALVHRLLPGTPLWDHASPDGAAVGASLGELLRVLHETPLGEVAHLVRAPGWSLVDRHAEAVHALQAVGRMLPADTRRSTEFFLAEALPPEAPGDALVLTHDDLGAEHVIVDGAGARVVGIIDWSDAAIGDPAVDLARLHRDLGPEAVARALGAMGPAAEAIDVRRVRAIAGFCALEDVAYGLGPGPRAYAERALANLDRTLAPVG